MRRPKTFFFTAGFISGICFCAVLVFSIGYVLVKRKAAEYRKKTFSLPSPPSIEEKKKYTPIKLVDMNRDTITLSTDNKNCLFINFWASWCNPCKREMSSLKVLYDKFKEQNIVFYFASPEEIEKIAAFQSSSLVNLPYYSIVQSDLNKRRYPTSYIISPSGSIVYEHTGAADWSDSLFGYQMSQLLQSF